MEVTENQLNTWRHELHLKGELVFVVRVAPNARKTKLKEQLADESLKVTLAAPPEKGKANKELLRLFSNIFKVPRSMIEVVYGHASRVKKIKIYYEA